MRDSFTPEEVDRIENTAFEVGFRIGGSQERYRIIALLEEWLADDHGDFDKILERIKNKSND